MKHFFFLFLALTIISCGQTFNSNSNDNTAYLSSDNSLSNSEAFAIIKSQCISCHLGSHANWATRTTDQSWIDAGDVVKGDPDGSQFITRMQNAGGDMPILNPQIPDSEYQILRTWIQDMP